MPELVWKGKDKVVNHHLEVPVRTLDHRYTFGGGSEGKSGNRIIHGDNLEALKALLPQYEGRVKCIYIDPPYNTGNEGWVYNDNVNDPRIKKWLGEVVGKEGEDLCRHDKWLCMMYPRLQLLKRLLAEDGSIWISIDDGEVAGLRLLLDEIFGRHLFIGNIVWQHSVQPKGYSEALSIHHNHILAYANSAEFQIKDLPRQEEHNVNYANPDNDPKGEWRSGDVRNALYRPNLIYDISTPSGKVIKPPEKGWRWSRETLQAKIDSGEIVFSKDETRIIRKIYLKDQLGRPPESIWFGDNVGTTRQANSELKQIFDTASVTFDTPKPTRLIERVLQIAADSHSIILDSFAGSGTTAHAVLNLNKQDGGSRRFILIEMMDYAESITAERVRRVIEGYGEGGKKVEGTGGGFDFYALGEHIFDGEGNLNEAIGAEKIRRYVAWTEKLPGAEAGEHPYWLGERNRTGYYFYYEPERLTVLNLDFLATLRRRSESYLIYADTCLLEEAFMRRHNIRFKKIPRDISRF